MIGMDVLVAAAPAPLVAALLGVLALAAMWEPRPVRARSEPHDGDK